VNCCDFVAALLPLSRRGSSARRCTPPMTR
jgi:hypothetical protein